LARVAVASPPITVLVDASEAPRHVLRVRLSIPAAPGALTLWYPKWSPGGHAPIGPLSNLAALRFSSRGKPIAWRRDPVELFAFHLEVPPGADRVDAEFELLGVTGSGTPSLNQLSSEKLAVVNWGYLLLYPDGKTAREIQLAALLKLPAGRKWVGALEPSRPGAGGPGGG